jgi:peroxiredoxin
MAMGEQASSRAAAMTTLDAPNFTLSDIHGDLVSLSDFANRKKLILAWSSW